MEKLKVLIIGGDPRRNRSALEKLQPYLDYDHISQDGKISPQSIQDRQVIVVITDFVSQHLWTAAKKIRTNLKGVPVDIVKAKTVNHVLNALQEHKQFAPYIHAALREHNKKTSPEPPSRQVQVDPVPMKAPADAMSANTVEAIPPVCVVTPTSDGSTQQEERSGLTAEQLWDKYSDSLIMFVRTAMTPGDKLHEKDLVVIMSEMVGLPAFDVREVLPELAIRGIVKKIGTATWKVPDLNGDVSESEVMEEEEVEETIENDSETTEKQPKPKRDHIVRMVELISGLPTGPYDHKRDIVRLAQKSPDFRMLSGDVIKTAGYGDIILLQAERFGIVEKRDGKWWVNTDSRVKVTIIEDKPKDSPATAPVPKKNPTFEERVAMIMHKESPKTATAASQDGLARTSASDVIRQSYELQSIPTLGSWLTGMRILKSHLPDVHWDEMACVTVARKLKTRDIQSCMKYRGEFSQAEWDYLAWESLREIPPKLWVQLLRPRREDMQLHCSDCLEKFVFTVQEQDFYESKFGDVTPPKRCPKCRKLAKARI